MSKTEFIRARVDEDLKINVEKIFNQLGLTMTEAITLFLKQCELNQGLPFEVRLPNELTQKAMEDAQKGIGLHEFDSLDEMFAELERD